MRRNERKTNGRAWRVWAAITGTAVAAALLAAPSLVSSGDANAAASPDCSAGRVLTVVAHADDDLLFDGTALRKDIDAGRCVRSVVVTAGDAGKSATYWKGRQTGLMASYASIAGVASKWTSGTLSVAGKTLPTQTLTAAPRLSLVFMQLPDGNLDGSGFPADRSESLQHLYEGSLTTIHTVTGAQYTASYTLAQLRSALLGIITAYAPTDVHTLDNVGTYGDGDHSDHHTVAFLTDAAQKQYTGTHTFTGYMGYPIADRPSNLTTAQTQAKSTAFFAYSAYDAETCASTSACSSRPEGSWLSREYTAGSTVTPPTTPTDPPTTRGTDVTAGATVTASAENPADGQTAAKAVDGVFSGYPDAPTAEWAAPNGGVGTWIQLGWTGGASLNEIDLSDRPNADDQVTGGTLTFSDGSSVAVPSLDNAGAVQRVAFSARQVTWARFTVTSVSATTRNTGLSEIRAYAPVTTPTDPTTPTTPTTLQDVTAGATATAIWDDASTGQLAAKAIDGVVSGYPADPTAEWVATWGTTGVWLQLDWAAPKSVSRVVLYDRPNTDDQVTSGTLTFSDGSQVAVGALDNSGAATTVDFSARSVSWVRFTVTGVSASTRNAGLSEFRVWG